MTATPRISNHSETKLNSCVGERDIQYKQFQKKLAKSYILSSEVGVQNRSTYLDQLKYILLHERLGKSRVKSFLSRFETIIKNDHIYTTLYVLLITIPFILFVAFSFTSARCFLSILVNRIISCHTRLFVIILNVGIPNLLKRKTYIYVPPALTSGNSVFCPQCIYVFI